MVADSEIQRIARLTPLADVLASFDLSVGPVEPREEAVSKALGLTLAASAVIADGHPKAALALRDGYAVRSDTTLDASSYAPAPLSPAPVRVDTGDAMPPAADAVAALDTVQMRGAQAGRSPPVAPGEGVLAPDADATAGLQLRLAGARLRRIDVALLDRARRRARAGAPAARARGARRRGRRHSRRRHADCQRHRCRKRRRGARTTSRSKPR